jgi:hypothetical protein
MFQSGRVRDAAWESDWVGTPISHQRSINIIMTVTKDFVLTAGKIIPVCRRTVMLVRNSTVVVVVDFTALLQQLDYIASMIVS